MRKLDKQAIADRDRICKQLREHHEKLNEAINALNEAIQERWEAVEEAMTEYNEVVADAVTWQESIGDDIQSYIDERSEKWQESDKAQEYTAWQSAFEDLLELVELEQPDGLDEIDEDVAGLLEQMPEEVGG